MRAMIKEVESNIWLLVKFRASCQFSLKKIIILNKASCKEHMRLLTSKIVYVLQFSCNSRSYLKKQTSTDVIHCDFTAFNLFLGYLLHCSDNPVFFMIIRSKSRIKLAHNHITLESITFLSHLNHGLIVFNTSYESDLSNCCRS